MTALEASEANDCTVKSLQRAFDIPYDTAHYLCARFGRKPRQGFYINADLLGYMIRAKLIEALPDIFNCRVKNVKWDKAERYLVLISGHAFCIKDGVSDDWRDNKEDKIERAYRVMKGN